jgi:drug/metabolite transporter (DMT)-like permease
MVFAGTLLAYVWWNMGIQHVGAGRTAIFTNLVPVFGVLIAWWVWGERLPLVQLLGAALCLLGVWVCQYVPTIRPPRPPSEPRWVPPQPGEKSA